MAAPSALTRFEEDFEACVAHLRPPVTHRRVVPNDFGEKPVLKLINTGVLLFLNYTNAAASLPQTIARPDPDFLAATLTIVVGLCALMFASGWVIARLVRSGREHRVSLMFGLGMNNNGTGLVMAAMALTDHPRVLLPIIFYNLVQHLVAGTADRIIGDGEAARGVMGEEKDETAPFKVVGTWERLATSR